MPKINVYLPDDLADAVKETGLPVSAICQTALETAIRRVTDIRDAAALDQASLDGPAASHAYFTARASNVVSLAAEQARNTGAAEVATEHLLGGLLAEGSNMALRVLRSLEIDPADVAAALAALRSSAPGQASPPGRAAAQDVPPARYPDGQAARALELSAIESLSLGHSYVGSEHILLGLIAEPDGAAGQLLRSLGAEQRMTRRSVAAALGGYAQARSERPTRPAATAAKHSPGAGPAGLDQALQSVMQRLDRIEGRLELLSAPPSPA